MIPSLPVAYRKRGNILLLWPCRRRTLSGVTSSYLMTNPRNTIDIPEPYDLFFHDKEDEP